MLCCIITLHIKKQQVSRNIQHHSAVEDVLMNRLKMEKFIVSNCNPFISNQKYANIYSITTKHTVHLVSCFILVTVLSFTHGTLTASSTRDKQKCNKLKTSCELSGVQSRLNVLHPITETKVSQATRK